MRYFFLSLALCLAAFSTNIKGQSETEQVKAVINQLFEGMQKSDSALVSSVFTKEIIMQTIKRETGAGTRVEMGNADDFLVSIAQAKPGTLNEEILNYKINIDGNLASVWTSYKFFVGEDFSHCGVNSFQLIKKLQGWQIFHIVDTRRRQNCD